MSESLIYVKTPAFAEIRGAVRMHPGIFSACVCHATLYAASVSMDTSSTHDHALYGVCKSKNVSKVRKLHVQNCAFILFATVCLW